MSESPLESVKSDIAIEFDNSQQAKIIYDSIILELFYLRIKFFNYYMNINLLNYLFLMPI